jgi:hypothetical protein
MTPLEWPAENEPFPGEEPDGDDDDFDSDDEPELLPEWELD